MSAVKRYYPPEAFSNKYWPAYGEDAQRRHAEETSGVQVELSVSQPPQAERESGGE